MWKLLRSSLSSLELDFSLPVVCALEPLQYKTVLYLTIAGTKKVFRISDETLHSLIFYDESNEALSEKVEEALMRSEINTLYHYATIISRLANNIWWSSCCQILKECGYY